LQLWLGKLEQQGHVSSGDNYQALISAIAKDICNRGHYCQARHKVKSNGTKITVSLSKEVI